MYFLQPLDERRDANDNLILLAFFLILNHRIKIKKDYINLQRSFDSASKICIMGKKFETILIDY
jgi:hypothetical protein